MPEPDDLVLRPPNLHDAYEALLFLNALELLTLEQRTEDLVHRLDLSTVPAATAFRIAFVRALGELAHETPQPATHNERS